MIQLTNDFVIVVPVWNGEETIIRALDSILSQNYEDLGVIIKDDLSDDRTPEVLMDYFGIRPGGPIRFRFQGRDILWIRNSVKMYGGGNTYDAVINHTANSDAIVGVVDGDDHLIRSDAFEKISRVYEEQDKWLVWSQHQRKSGNPGHSSALPDDDRIYTNRKYWAVSHFRTCKAWLFRHIRRQDLNDPFLPGSFMKIACDAALLYPMIELCGNEKAYFLDEILYQYEDQLPTNEDNFYPELVARYSDFIRNQGRTYSRLILSNYDTLV